MGWVYGIAAIFSLGFLIVVHEGGHYFVAHWCRMRIERFSIGFGPGILKRRSKKTGTLFQLAPIPFGGFVEIRVMNIAEDVDPDDKFAYPNRPAWQRFVTIFAGPATNYISALVLALALFTCHGMDSSWRWYAVAGVNQDYDAYGKLEVGDRILAIDHHNILSVGEYTLPSGEVLRGDTGAFKKSLAAKKGAPVTLTVLRDGKQLDLTLKPKLETEKEKDGSPIYRLGISLAQQPDVLDVGIVTAAVGAVEYPIEQTKAIASGLWQIVTREQEADPGGPVRIFDEFSRAWELGFVPGIKLLMVLSVYLGLFNLLPLPALDGGRLVFLGYEMVTRRRANPKIETMIHMGGIMVLGVVMVLVTLHDLSVF